ncbi:hypothetical protein [Streptomyces sp. NPDC015350]|uniref:aromatic-ring hydroxylase C-terminal domain-containing protein n=1 Tax=Streptomyces sp. NPDC015350 TaxID=3364955 RepID=UPI003703174E
MATTWAGGSPSVDCTAPDFRFSDGTSLGDLLREGKGVALDFTTGQSLQETAACWKDRMRYALGPVGNDLGCGALLIRPDGVVAWAEGRGPDPETFWHTVIRWFGEPTP